MTSVLFCLASPSGKITTSPADSDGLISSGEGGEGKAAVDGSVEIASAKGEETISSGELNPSESSGSKFSTSVGSLYTSPSPVIKFLSNSALP